VVPSLQPKTPIEHQMYEEADKRRTARFELKRRCSIPMSTTTTSTTSTSTIYEHADNQLMKIIMPQHSNSVGITFGGQIISWIEHCAYIAATRCCRARLITASMDGLQFLRSSKVGDILTVRARVSHVFDRSVEVYITVHSDRLGQDEPQFTNDAWITFVSVNENEEPCLIDKTKISVANTESGAKEFILPSSSALERKARRLSEKKSIIENDNV
jgi:acyl-CoA hydrolase